MAKNKRIKGAGDIIKAVTDTIGIAPCKDCTDSKNILNVWFPFGKVKPLTDIQKEWYGDYLKRKTNVLQNDDRLKITEIYNDAFGTDIAPCTSCSGLYVAIIKKLTKLYDYEN